MLKTCNKHKCKRVCCPIKSGAPDPEGLHLCVQHCGKPLACGKHHCEEFCHLGFCPPCKVFSNHPAFCACGRTRQDPPILCGSKPPHCPHPCGKIKPCGHECTSLCHPGECPDCLVSVDKRCECGKMVMSTYCSNKAVSCGKKCH